VIDKALLQEVLSLAAQGVLGVADCSNCNRSSDGRRPADCTCVLLCNDFAKRAMAHADVFDGAPQKEAEVVPVKPKSIKLNMRYRLTSNRATAKAQDLAAEFFKSLAGAKLESHYDVDRDCQVHNLLVPNTTKNEWFCDHLHDECARYAELVRRGGFTLEVDLWDPQFNSWDRLIY